MEIRSAYSPHVHIVFDQSIPDPKTGELQTSMTKQSFHDETDINQIMAKFAKTGLIDHVKNHGGYSNMPDGLEYQDAMQLTIDAQIAFDELPAKVRKEFDNDPFVFLSFIEDPDNVDRMRELGLLEPIDEDSSPEDNPSPEAASEPASNADE